MAGERFYSRECDRDDVVVYRFMLEVVKPERIKPVARFLCDNMALFFVPAGVGIVNALDILSQYWQAVLVAWAVSTVMVIVVVASIQQWFEKHRKGAEDR